MYKHVFFTFYTISNYITVQLAISISYKILKVHLFLFDLKNARNLDNKKVIITYIIHTEFISILLH